MNALECFDFELAERDDVTKATSAVLCENFSRAFYLWIGYLKSDGKFFFFGNDGSAGDAQHFVTELTVRYKQNKPAIAADCIDHRQFGDAALVVLRKTATYVQQMHIFMGPILCSSLGCVFGYAVAR